MLNTSYLNRTFNKTIRRLPFYDYEFIVWHETANSSGDEHQTLRYNLKQSVQTSYNYLIARNGTIYHYVDEVNYVSWHAGVKSSWLGRNNYDVNFYSIGVEFDGANDGTPITNDQGKSAIWLINYLCSKYPKLNKTLQQNPEHYQVAPSHKTDSKGCDMYLLLTAAQCTENDTMYKVLADDSNVRSSANRKSKITTKLKKGDIILSERTKLGENVYNNEVWVELKDKTGFIHSSLVEIVELSAQLNYNIFTELPVIDRTRFKQIYLNGTDENIVNFIYDIILLSKLDHHVVFAIDSFILDNDFNYQTTLNKILTCITILVNTNKKDLKEFFNGDNEKINTIVQRIIEAKG